MSLENIQASLLQHGPHMLCCVLAVRTDWLFNNAFVDLWHLLHRRTQTPTWHFRKCLGHQRDPTCGYTRYLSPCWMMKRWRSWWRRVWRNTAVHLFLYVLRRSVLCLLDHPSVWPALNFHNVKCILFCLYIH